jgi:predicted metalloprotease with PDZ domain
MRRTGFLILWVWVAVAPAAAAPPVDYTISLANAREHLLTVRIHVAGTSAERDMQLPVWNALYQVRDFAQYVRRVTAKNAAGQPLPVRKLDKTTWRVSRAESGADIEYEILAELPGPFGAHANGTHVFLNLAMVLMYPVDSRDAPMTVTFTDVPAGWRIATALPALRSGVYTGRNYDRLVDGPVEIGTFREISFEEGGATYRIVVDADPADYDLDQIKRWVRQIVTAGVWWMDDRPFTSYLFLYHFPRGHGGGGMEHAYSTAIDVSADYLRENPLEFTAATAHEFFHLWNVKRLRPQSLEPIDYTRENFTVSLWFAEGVTSTVADLLLLHAGLMSERQYLDELTKEIRMLELRPAHLVQSVEEASLDTWFDKYPQYRTPERSVNYYNKGRILGMLLDLAVRERSGGRKSLRDVLQWMNRNYANEARYYPDSAGVQRAAEAVTGTDFSQFFRDYVAAAEELPYNELLGTVGLKLERSRTTVLDPGFLSVRNFDQPSVVVSVDPGGEAERAGLSPGDTILTVNGKPLSDDLENRLAGMKIGETLRLRVTGRKGSREVKIKLGSRDQESFAIVELPSSTPQQRARRAAWLASQPDEAVASTP